MKYDAIIGKIFNEGEDKIFLFFLDPETNKLRDGLDLLDSAEIYKTLTYDTLIVVEVILKDGTQEVDIDINDFIDGKYGKYDIFIHIKDLLVFKLGKKIDNDEDDVTTRTIEEVILDGEFQEIGTECIQLCKEEMKEIKQDNDIQFFD